MNRALLLAPAALAILGLGCSSDPLVGTWTRSYVTFGITITEDYVVSGDGTLGMHGTGAGSCTGAEDITGYTWAATASSVTFSGTPACTGGLTCGAVTFACDAQSAGLKAGSCTYAFSNENNTLTLSSCSGVSDMVLTRTE